MDAVSLTPERKAQLDDYAKRHGQNATSALDDLLAEALEWDQQEFEKSVTAIRRGYEEAKAGRTKPANEFFEDVRVKYGFPG